MSTSRYVILGLLRKLNFKEYTCDSKLFPYKIKLLNSLTEKFRNKDYYFLSYKFNCIKIEFSQRVFNTQQGSAAVLS